LQKGKEVSFVLVTLAVSFLPLAIALVRKHRNCIALGTLNVLAVLVGAIEMFLIDGILGYIAWIVLPIVVVAWTACLVWSLLR